MEATHFHGVAAGVLFSSATADNAVHCIIGYPSVRYTALHYWTVIWCRFLILLK